MPFPARPSRCARVVAVVLAALTLTLLVGPVGPASTAGAQTINPVTPDNRPSTVPGVSNGYLPDYILNHVTPSCRTYFAAAPSLISMMVAAAADGVTLIPSDCYRDYAGQVAARDYWCSQGACYMAAVPGTSNHGWGKAVDFRDQNGSFTWTSRGYLWMKANAWKYGWNHAAVFWPTGSVPEPWHWEWVGDGGRLYPGISYGIGEGIGLPGNGSPTGHLDAATVPFGSQSVRVQGWTIDGNTTRPIEVHILVDGRTSGWAMANVARSDVARAVFGYSAYPHGFSFDVPLWPGTREVCAVGMNTGAGGNTLLGCKNVTVGSDPFGAVDHVVTDKPVPEVTGWAIDPDRIGPIDLHVYVNGRFAAAQGGGEYRGDVAAIWPQHGSQVGYRIPVPLVQGANQVCVYGINVGPGVNSLIGCRSVTVDRNPFGSLDEASVSAGTLTLRGWAIDPDTTASLPIHVWVSATRHVITADQWRPDVGRAFPGYGDNHGFYARVPIPAGRHTVCAYAINQGTGTVNTAIGGCRTITA